MKVIAINGSGRKDGNTAILLNLVLDELMKYFNIFSYPRTETVTLMKCGMGSKSLLLYIQSPYFE